MHALCEPLARTRDHKASRAPLAALAPEGHHDLYGAALRLLCHDCDRLAYDGTCHQRGDVTGLPTMAPVTRGEM